MNHIVPKKWAEFQHYKDRSPSWLKLHKALLDDYSFHSLPLASKALAPLLWLLASEYNEGQLPLDFDMIAFRLRVAPSEAKAAITPLIDKGFFILLQDASGLLAECLPREEDIKQRREENNTLEISDEISAVDPVVKIVLKAYHEKLPSCEAMKALTPKRKKRILTANKLAQSICKENGIEFSTASFWESCFGECSEDKWLRGDTPNPNNPKWKQNLTVLLAEERFAGIMDKAIAAMERDA